MRSSLAAGGLSLFVLLAWQPFPAAAQQQPTPPTPPQIGTAHKVPKADPELIANAMSAAPRAVARDATIVAIEANGQRRTLRQGKGEFTCIPDDPETPGNDPMCMDKNGFEWALAWLTKQQPPAGKVGLIYMLKGGSDASNDDPFAKRPAPGKKWVDTGPHMMIVGATQMMQGYPKNAQNPKAPYIMWPGTPYEHIMIPVR